MRCFELTKEWSDFEFHWKKFPPFYIFLNWHNRLFAFYSSSASSVLSLFFRSSVSFLELTKFFIEFVFISNGSSGLYKWQNWKKRDLDLQWSGWGALLTNFLYGYVPNPSSTLCYKMLGLSFPFRFSLHSLSYLECWELISDAWLKMEC